MKCYLWIDQGIVLTNIVSEISNIRQRDYDVKLVIVAGI